jgi:hypothetical protein
VVLQPIEWFAYKWLTCAANVRLYHINTTNIWVLRIHILSLVDIGKSTIMMDLQVLVVYGMILCESIVYDSYACIEYK